jgi:hypothetical protein
MECFVGEGEVTDPRVTQSFDIGAAELDVMGRPPHAELVAANAPMLRPNDPSEGGPGSTPCQPGLPEVGRFWFC